MNRIIYVDMAVSEFGMPLPVIEPNHMFAIFVNLGCCAKTSLKHNASSFYTLFEIHSHSLLHIVSLSNYACLS